MPNVRSCGLVGAAKWFKGRGPGPIGEEAETEGDGTSLEGCRELPYLVCLQIFASKWTEAQKQGQASGLAR